MVSVLKFVSLQVDTALTEAYDIHKCISPLKVYFTQMHEVGQYVELTQVFKPMIHCLSLVWKTSKVCTRCVGWIVHSMLKCAVWQYYTVSNLVVLVQEICNDMIKLTQEFVGGDRIFSVETVDAVESLEVALEVLSRFKTCFFDYKQQSNRLGICCAFFGGVCVHAAIL